MKIGSLSLPNINDRFGHLERISLVRSALEANQELLLNALTHFAALSTSVKKIYPSILKKLVARLVDSEKHYLNGMRNGALGFTYSTLGQLKESADTLPPPQRAEIVSIIGNDLLMKIDGLVSMQYPIRVKNQKEKDLQKPKR